LRLWGHGGLNWPGLFLIEMQKLAHGLFQVLKLLLPQIASDVLPDFFAAHPAYPSSFSFIIHYLKE
jgi:hypothetical protein